MNLTAKKPEDIMSDSESSLHKNGKTIRKGTMAAAMANAEIIENPNVTKKEKEAALQILQSLAPTMKAFGVTEYFRWKNSAIQEIFENCDVTGFPPSRE